MILIDLQKAFDTTDHQTLIEKMKYLGFPKNVIAWFKPYLIERKFKTNINTLQPIEPNMWHTPRTHSRITPVFVLYK